MRSLSILFILILVFFSCKKKESEFIIKGTITDNTFNKGLENANVKIYKVLSGTSNQELAESITLNSDGNYSFKIKRDKTEKYIITISKSNYFDQTETINFSSLTIEKDNVFNYSTTAKSWVKIHFYNLSPQNTDELQFMKQEGKTNCDECCIVEEHNLYGFVDSSFYCINDGNTPYSVLYSVKNTNDIAIKSIITVPFDTTELYIQY